MTIGTECSFEEIRELLSECSDGEALLADGFEDALIGTVEGWFGGSHRVVALYDWPRCVQILVGEGMEEDEAVEFMEFNVTGAYVGPATPVFAVIHRRPVIAPAEP